MMQPLRINNSSYVSALWALSVFLLFGQSITMAEDWPQWMGPERNNVWYPEKPLESFPKEGPQVVWRSPLAGGYAGPAVVGNRLLVTDYVTSDNVKVDNFGRQTFTGTERVLCVDETTGETIWKHEYPVVYDISYPAGPRCTPLVEGDFVYTLGAVGHLICFNKSSGEIVWQKVLPTEYKAKVPLWGYSAHPLIDGDLLYSVAGVDGSHMVALKKQTGEEVWRSQSQPEQGYTPPSIVTIGGKRQLLAVGPAGINSLNPQTGERFWTTPYDADNGSIIMTPMILGEHLFLGGFNNRNLLVKLNADGLGVKQVWKDKKDHGMSPVNVQPFAIDDVLYGFDASGELMAVEIPSGKRLWKTTKPLGNGRKAGSGTAFIVKENDRFWLFNENGELIIAKLSRAKYDELARTKSLIEPTNNAFGRAVVWCAPAFANGKLYVRNDKELISVNLSRD